MNDVLGPGSQLGYCCNVHAGIDIDTIKQNILTHSLEVKKKVSPTQPMGVGLWLPENAVDELLKQSNISLFKDFLDEHQLIPFTFNGFPYGNFHEPIVKHKVYEPDWARLDRFNYTLSLIEILKFLRPESSESSISTLPIGWPNQPCRPYSLDVAAHHLLQIAMKLKQIEQEEGKLIHLDIEPEPGCELDTCQDVIDFYQKYLFGQGHDDIVRRHLRICHDICHSMVMQEDQVNVLKQYINEGINIGKIQISSAIKVPFDRLSDLDKLEAFDQLKAFKEDRYLHQTMIQEHLYDDLPIALSDSVKQDLLNHEWRIHYHVPLFLDASGHIETCQDEINQCLSYVCQNMLCNHFETETYAWDVLPDDLKMSTLSEGLAKELQWILDQAKEY